MLRWKVDVGPIVTFREQATPEQLSYLLHVSVTLATLLRFCLAKASKSSAIVSHTMQLSGGGQEDRSIGIVVGGTISTVNRMGTMTADSYIRDNTTQRIKSMRHQHEEGTGCR